MGLSTLSQLPPAELPLSGREIFACDQGANGTVGVTAGQLLGTTPNAAKEIFLDGFIFTVPAGISRLIAYEATALAMGTVIMMESPGDGQGFEMFSYNEIAALSVSPNSGQFIMGAPDQMFVNSSFGMFYNASDSTWYRRW